MLLTTPSYTPPMPRYTAYTPPRSSPLSERCTNVAPRPFMSSPIQEKMARPQRAFKPNPVMQTRDAATKRRRDMFFKRVQNGREDKKWEARREQIQQLDFVSERKRWEAEKARQAPPENDDMVDETFDDAVLLENATTEVDYVAAQEEYELQQLVASMEQHDDARSRHYGSDEEDYDEIFMECAMAEHGQEARNGFGGGGGDEMDMDMTDG
ncbi:hypothetical protein BDW02DRAFT_574816 [Decorospora gaudefroyi]|uniref:Uncharacterized protein n=1 Tax=Decorospora gaudefroyi TaxID=184978 RepID=A0A6A5K236_9PLEO|nr:hypothetical protein BDW02DRAFT_574816 [Decorospora gaudefroyi]